MSIRALLDQLEPPWLSKDAPAGEAEIDALVSDSPFDLPRDYTELLRCTNGAEAKLMMDPWWFQLWSTKEAIEANRGYEVERWHPDYRGFGSSGGGVMFAFKRLVVPDSKVFGVPFDSISPEDVYVIANDLSALLRGIGEWSEVLPLGLPTNQPLHWTGATTVLVIRSLVVGPGQ